jgi:hypothetical protein
MSSVWMGMASSIANGAASSGVSIAVMSLASAGAARAVAEAAVVRAMWNLSLSYPPARRQPANDRHHAGRARRSGLAHRVLAWARHDRVHRRRVGRPAARR